MAPDAPPSPHPPRDLSDKSVVDTTLADNPVFEGTRRTTMRVGNAFFIILGFAIFIPMIIGVSRGISNDMIWDPYTGARLTGKEGADECEEEARRLLLDAGRLSRLEPTWAKPYREWRMRCMRTHPEFNRALTRTRDTLRKNK